MLSFLVLVELRLKSNMFASTISEHVGKLTNLETFDIHANFFEGTLPETLNQLSRLSECKRTRCNERQGRVWLLTFYSWSFAPNQ
jgi:hypothetical protein